MSLRPEKDITKILLSTPSRIVDEYEDSELLITHAWDFTEPVFRYDKKYLILTAKTTPIEEVRDYTFIGDVFCVYLGILYGKRFDNLGLVESLGISHVPRPSPAVYDHDLPFNNEKSRPDLEIPLNLKEFKRLTPLLGGHADKKFMRFLNSSGRFYIHALQHAESQPEIAYLDLITCGEILSNFFKYDPNDLLDDRTKESFAQISVRLENGQDIVRQIHGRMRQIKRKFEMTILHLLNPHFFQRTEAIQPDMGVLRRDEILVRIKATYNLRSSYVHTGKNFGDWVKTHRQFCNEVRLGIKDPSVENVLFYSPTIVGMERIMRYCLLRFIHLYGTPVDSRLDGDGLLSEFDSLE